MRPIPVAAAAAALAAVGAPLGPHPAEDSMCRLVVDGQDVDHDVQAVLDFYYFQCALKMNCIDLARSLQFLADRGRCPSSGEQVTSIERARRTNAVMMTCGTYDAAGEFAFRIGLPCKSGVGGGIVRDLIANEVPEVMYRREQLYATAAAAGATTMILTNGAGGIKEHWTPGTPVLISDHINLTAASPLEGATFIDLTDLYSARLRGLAREIDPVTLPFDAFGVLTFTAAVGVLLAGSTSTRMVTTMVPPWPSSTVRSNSSWRRNQRYTTPTPGRA